MSMPVHMPASFFTWLFVCVGNTLRAGSLPLCFQSVLFSVLGKQLPLICGMKALLKIGLVEYDQSFANNY